MEEEGLVAEGIGGIVGGEVRGQEGDGRREVAKGCKGNEAGDQGSYSESSGILNFERGNKVFFEFLYFSSSQTQPMRTTAWSLAS